MPQQRIPNAPSSKSGSANVVSFPSARPKPPPGEGAAEQSSVVAPSRPSFPRRNVTTRKKVRLQGLHLVLRGDVYQINGTYRGRRIRVSTEERCLERAEKALTLKRQELERSFDLEHRVFKVSFGEAVNAYLAHAQRSEATVKTTIKIRELVGESTLCEDIDQAMVSDIADDALGEDATAQNRKRTIFTPVKAVLNFAWAEFGHKRGCFEPKFHRISDGKPRDFTVLPHVAEQIVERAKRSGQHLLAAVVQVACCEGPRRGELFKLKWSDIDLDRRRCILRHTKASNNEIRDRTIIDLRPRSVDALREYRSRVKPAAEDKYVFVRPEGLRYADVGSFGSAMNKQLKEIAGELRIETPVTLHVLRHTAASWHYAVVKDYEKVRKRMDWRSAANAIRYIHEISDESAAEVPAFWQLTG